MKLDFVIPGFSKCGTTTLCSLLCEHPDIFIPGIKEPNFFAHRYAEGWDWYESLFERASRHQLWGDGSTWYTAYAFAEQSCEGILQHFPEARFIFIARNPIKRLESSFREFHHSGYKYKIETPQHIQEALRALPNMIADSRYWSLINIYRHRVPDDRIHVLFLEDFKLDPAGELKKCFAFLGVNEQVCIKGVDRQLNAGSTKYYDTKLMRLIRRNRWANRQWSKMNHQSQQEWGRRLGLRKRLTQPIEWTPQTRRWLYQTLGDEANKFLEFHGKPADFWGFEAWAAESRSVDRAAA